MLARNKALLLGPAHGGPLRLKQRNDLNGGDKTFRGQQMKNDTCCI